MIRHILVPSNGLEANLLEDAFKLANPFSAHVDVLHVGWEAMREMHFYDNRLSPEMLDTMISEAQREAEKISKAARNKFDLVTTAASVPVTTKPMSNECMTAEWREITGSVARVFGAEARAADLTLLSRPTEKFADLEILEAALLESGRPILLRAGDMSEINRSVVIAWDGSLAAVRAVAGAQDFIARAGMVTIVIVEGDREDASETPIVGRLHPRSERLARHLAWHGVKASVLTAKQDGRSVGETLATAAMELSAGLLVMGGYGHSRLREIVLGGATRYMLNHPINCPVLLAH
jgi:nucleotide-binding universal stress UspA family protein